MARGWDNVQATAQAQEEARQRGSVPQLFASAVNPSKGGSPITARFLEQGPDVNNYRQHEYRVPDGKGGTYPRRFTCLKESPWNRAECPGCQANLPLKLRGVYNIIWRGRPQLRKGSDGKALRANGQYIIDGYADEVVMLDVPSTTAEMLRQKEVSLKGLMSRDVILGYSGNSFQPWTCEPADIDGGPQPLSENDQRLLAAKTHLLDDVMKPPNFQEAAQLVAQYGHVKDPNRGGGSSPQGTAGAAGAANGFMAGANVPPGAAFGAAQGQAQGQVPLETGAPPAAPPAPAPAAQPAYPPQVPENWVASGWTQATYEQWLREQGHQPVTASA